MDPMNAPPPLPPRQLQARVTLEVNTDLLEQAILQGKELKFLEAVLTGALSEYGIRVKRLYYPHKATLAKARRILKRLHGGRDEV